MSPQNKCETCCAFVKDEQGPNGQCRRRAPIPFVFPVPATDSLGRPGVGIQSVSAWPAVQSTQGCLEWAPQISFFQ